ncbi:MmcB family DNA repair protein [Rhodobacterales bacterium FZCC0083]|nr:MmcB family DNA repair protein [Rhodobacterales bacterium FZCC0083]
MDLQPQKKLTTGQLLARGMARHLAGLGFVSLEEFPPIKGLRVDLLALGRKSEIWIIECKSSREDFMSDEKWQNYLLWCDQYFWAVPTDFPVDILPEQTGVFWADGYDAELMRDAPISTLSPARRKSIIHRFARRAARRLAVLRDPAAQY